MINQFTTLVQPEIVSEGELNQTQEECKHKNVKLYDGFNPFGLAVCLDCGVLVGNL